MKRPVRATLSTLTIIILFLLLPPPTSAGDENRELKREVREFQLGEITIKGEKENPQVYFIIPKAKFSLQRIPLNDDIIWEIGETYIEVK